MYSIEPLVSVVVPFYDNVLWLDEALSSVFSQTYSNIEVLVINDGSPENIDNIKSKFNKVNFITKKNGGPSSARNLGIKKSSGKYIAFLDSDDIWHSNKLKLQITQMEKKKSVWSHHSYEMFWNETEKNKIINTENLEGDVFKKLYISFKAQTSCFVVLSSVLVDNNIYFPMNKRYGQDIAFFKEIAKKYPLDHVNAVLSKFRVRGSNAGLRASVQLADKAATRNEIYNSQKLKEMLPIHIKVAYELSYHNFIFMNKITKGRDSEFISKVFYLVPYILFKL